MDGSILKKRQTKDHFLGVRWQSDHFLMNPRGSMERWMEGCQLALQAALINDLQSNKVQILLKTGISSVILGCLGGHSMVGIHLHRL